MKERIKSAIRVGIYGKARTSFYEQKIRPYYDMCFSLSKKKLFFIVSSNFERMNLLRVHRELCCKIHC